MAADATFYFDLASAECYLAAERALERFAPPVAWEPVHAPERFPSHTRSPREVLERRAAELGVQPLRWPARHPVNSTRAMLAATYAKEIGRGVAFAQAAFRQAFAGGHSLADDDYVLIAAAACEMHPNAVLRALDRRGVREALARASDDAARAGVTELPTVKLGDRLIVGGELLAYRDARGGTVPHAATVAPAEALAR
jgi:2-hydroxychromene-2-carboxylate isomerase